MDSVPFLKIMLIIYVVPVVVVVVVVLKVMFSSLNAQGTPSPLVLQTLLPTFLLKGRHQPVPFLYDTNLSACKTSTFIIFAPFLTFLLPRPPFSQDGAHLGQGDELPSLELRKGRQGGQLQMLWAIDSTTFAECLFVRCCHLLRVLER